MKEREILLKTLQIELLKNMTENNHSSTATIQSFSNSMSYGQVFNSLDRNLKKYELTQSRDLVEC